MDKQKIVFVAKSSAVYSIAYLFAGGIAYQLITKQFYIGENPIFNAYLRSEANPDLWAHTNMWLVPGLLLRALLISLVLLPFVGILKGMSFLKRTLVVFALLFILIHISAAAPSPGNIEGFIYMKPELFSLNTFLFTQPEMIAQCLLYAIGLSWVLKDKRTKDTKTPLAERA